MSFSMSHDEEMEDPAKGPAAILGVSGAELGALERRSPCDPAFHGFSHMDCLGINLNLDRQGLSDAPLCLEVLRDSTRTETSFDRRGGSGGETFGSYGIYPGPGRAVAGRAGGGEGLGGKGRKGSS